MELVTKYNRAAPKWDRKIHRLGYFQGYSQFLKGQTVNNGPVLDVGTGSGAFAQAWIAQAGSVDLTLMDLSSAMLNTARANLSAQGVHPKTIEARIEDYEAPSPFSSILAAHVVEHCADPVAAFQNFSRWLEPKGRLYLVISRPHWCNWLLWLRFRHRWFSAADVLHLAHRAGFQHDLTYSFASGPPSRTSLAYIFSKT